MDKNTPDPNNAKEVVSKVRECESCRYVATATLTCSGLYIGYGIFKPPFEIPRIGKRIIFTCASGILSATAFILAGAVFTDKLDDLTSSAVNAFDRTSQQLSDFDEKYQQYKHDWSQSLIEGKMSRLRSHNKLPTEMENDFRK